MLPNHFFSQLIRQVTKDSVQFNASITTYYYEEYEKEHFFAMYHTFEYPGVHFQ